MRAGIVRPWPLDGLVVDDGEGEATPVVGYPVRAYAEGFFQAGAWVRLATGSFEDLAHSSGLPPVSDVAFWRRTGIITLGPLIDEERFLFSLDRVPNAMLEHFAWPLVRLLKLPMPLDQVWALASGHCGLVEALQLAEKEVSARRLDRVVVLGADSYVDALSLDWLAQHRRLKTPTRQTGTIPGEVGACLLLESEVAARTRGALIGGQVVAATLGAAITGNRPRPPILGRALADAVLSLIPKPQREQSFRGTMLLDLNGEEWKAQVWGHAQVLLSEHLDLSRFQVLLPCESLGETGAASGPVAVCLAVSQFLLGDTAREHVVSCSISDLGRVGTVLLQPAAPPRLHPPARS
ncbi:hypothetical protein [Pyxidicoccus xibeiensis]|uniref:hypothetical protein n=1 Tax=Pyxidicoccus xibeiensis TaxID=2906759 RepID=UPI0020A8195C|nr:hypothetical protein [Pyxidicoccus xibeiensis]MCP3137893.1 hypothetical protein [Pyxidicoccus xibeiensis]